MHNVTRNSHSAHIPKWALSHQLWMYKKPCYLRNAVLFFIQESNLDISQFLAHCPNLSDSHTMSLKEKNGSLGTSRIKPISTSSRRNLFLQTPSVAHQYESTTVIFLSTVMGYLLLFILRRVSHCIFNTGTNQPHTQLPPLPFSRIYKPA